MSFAFTIEGEKEFANLLDELPKTFQRRVARSALLHSAKPIVKLARQNLKPYKRTGELIKAVKAQSAASGRKSLDAPVVVLVGATKDHGFKGRFLETGNAHQPARPWLRPAVDTGRPQFDQDLAKEIRVRIVHEADKLIRRFNTIKTFR